MHFILIKLPQNKHNSCNPLQYLIIIHVALCSEHQTPGFCTHPLLLLKAVGTAAVVRFLLLLGLLELLP